MSLLVLNCFQLEIIGMSGWHILGRLTSDLPTDLGGPGGQAAHGILSGLIVEIHTWKGLQDTLGTQGPASHNPLGLAQMCAWLSWHQCQPLLPGQCPQILPAFEIIHLTRFQFYIHLLGTFISTKAILACGVVVLVLGWV